MTITSSVKIAAMKYDVAEFLTNSDGASEILDVLDEAIDHIFDGTPNVCEALKRYASGEIPNITIDVDGTNVAGYGKRGLYNEWEFQLPEVFYQKYVV